LEFLEEFALGWRHVVVSTRKLWKAKGRKLENGKLKIEIGTKSRRL
jgi:hypothetical protein